MGAGRALPLRPPLGVSSGAAVVLPSGASDAALAQWGGTGFEWYDTNQAHIVTNTTFRRCGVRLGAHGVEAHLYAMGEAAYRAMLRSDASTALVMRIPRILRVETIGRTMSAIVRRLAPERSDIMSVGQHDERDAQRARGQQLQRVVPGMLCFSLKRFTR